MNASTLVCDASSLYARSYFAARNISPDCSETLRLMMSTIFNLLHPDHSKIGQISHTLFCWDAKADVTKKDAKHREPKPQSYYEIRDIAYDLVALLLGSVNIEQSPYEGDDLVASAVYQITEAPDADVYILSGDKDLTQLASKRVHYYSLNEKFVLSEAYICGKFHVKRPVQVAIALAIQGDPVDCIPGVRGWGPTKVRKIFNEVTKDMNFKQALAVVESHMNPEQHEQFYASLERTLPNMNIPVPPPAPLVFPDVSVVDSLGLPDVSRRFKEIKFLYEMF